ncbi:hypothetical protein DPMN_054415 [Dreissena polymorpha]|uniref:Uncharacterized protein n=1 Tax=Dreissena polymorpha TaxID=45954 RepID=A0A9D4HT25_DREPO|nr:hypothetical protein DPMN_054415 [Dreissena polymorpha]
MHFPSFIPVASINKKAKCLSRMKKRASKRTDLEQSQLRRYKQRQKETHKDEN